MARVSNRILQVGHMKRFDAGLQREIMVQVTAGRLNKQIAGGYDAVRRYARRVD